jgi:hypothetical protein
MKFNKFLLLLISVLAVSAVVSAQEASIQQLKQMMEKSAENLTTYTYSRSAETKLLYTNDSLYKEYDVSKVIDGKVDLVNLSGWWDSKLTDEENGNVLTWEGYFVNGSEYWKQGQNWNKLIVNNTSQILQDYNELPGEVTLIKYSNMALAGSERLQGIDSYKLIGSPIESIYEGMIGLQLLAAYFPSPFPLPDKLKNRTLDISNTSLMDNSDLIVTAWVSKNDSLLRRLDINSSLTITPKILNISSSDFRFVSTINESTIYNNFGSLLKVELPKEAQNESYRFNGTDWRWALFGSVRP